MMIDGHAMMIDGHAMMIDGYAMMIDGRAMMIDGLDGCAAWNTQQSSSAISLRLSSISHRHQGDFSSTLIEISSTYPRREIEEKPRIFDENNQSWIIDENLKSRRIDDF